MRKLEALTPEQLSRAEELLRNPPPGSKIEAAKEFGVDLTLVMSKLRLTPAERFSVMADTVRSAAAFRGAARKAK